MYYFQFYVALGSDKPLCAIWKEKYRPSGEPFCFEAKFSDGKVLARLAGLALQSRLHGKFFAKLIFSVSQTCRDPGKPSQPASCNRPLKFQIPRLHQQQESRNFVIWKKANEKIIRHFRLLSYSI